MKLKYLGYCLLPTSLLGNVYLHSPRGSNNRLNEKSAARTNGERLFFSNNNARGGYNVGQIDSSGTENQYEMKYFQSGTSAPSFYTVEWSQLLGCGTDEDGERQSNCKVVLQTACENADVSVFRNGYKTKTQKYSRGDSTESASAHLKRSAESSAADLGTHETMEFYERCSKMDGGDDGSRHGFECSEEREIHPYSDLSPWNDIAIFTDGAECDMSVYHKEKFECVEFYDATARRHFSSVTTEPDCVKKGGKWLGFYEIHDTLPEYLNEKDCLDSSSNELVHVWGRPFRLSDLSQNVLPQKQCLVLPPLPSCKESIQTRSNYLGNVNPGSSDNSQYPEMPRFQWNLPRYPSGEEKQCVLRIRYMLQSDNVSTGGHVTKPGVDLALPLPNLATKNGQVVFEDRSHTFRLVPRDGQIQEDQVLHNIVVRGKRGNIVQTFPAVEYDFVPNRLQIQAGEAVQFQWTGSNTHNNGNPGGDGQTGDAGEGKAGSDRHNLIQMESRKGNYPMPYENHTMFEQAEWLWNAEGMHMAEGVDRKLALSLGHATSGYYYCNSEECGSGYSYEGVAAKLNERLDNASPSFRGDVFVPAAGAYDYKCLRNDNFSNRSQKGSLVVL